MQRYRDPATPARPRVGRLLTLALLAGLASAAPAQTGSDGTAAAVDWDLLDQYCTDCHNLDDFAGSLALDLLPRTALAAEAEAWELVIRKLRTGMMPPAGKPRPPRQVLDAFTTNLGHALDREYAQAPNPGNEGLARLNRAEYRNAIRDLLHFDAAHVVATLPAESAGEGFDNNIELLSVSPTLIDAFASAAMRISREAVGDLTLIPSEVEYAAGSGSQSAHVDGLPLGTRGGLLVTHNFPLDARYQFSVNARGAGGIFNSQAFCAGGNQVVVSIDGALVEVEDPADFQLALSAGPHQIGVALQDLRRCAGVNDYYDDYSLDGAIAGLTINGPFEVSGAGDTPSRRAIFSCYPQQEAAAQACAREIFTRLASSGYRRPLDSAAAEVEQLLEFYAMGQAEGGFETGIQYGIARLLLDPRFLYQLEAEPEGLAPGSVYAVSDVELASRLSFFLWSSIPDQELLQLAAAGQLQDPAVLEQQVRRMLRDPKAAALVESFAGQWLKLRELEAAQPQDRAFDTRLMQAFQQETELLFADLVRQDRGLLSLIDSDYTWLNDQLAAHYGIEGVRGDYLRRVPLPADSPRRGLLGHGSILTATSVANRTSPVVRGAWIVEDLLGAPVPTPPPGVETDLGDEGIPEDVVVNTLRDRLELHRANPTCASCHQIMDPIGLALENFDLVGRWRTDENGFALNTRTELMDGTPIDGPVTLRQALLDRGDAVASTIIEKLLSYALGRHLHAPDMAAVRKIAAATAAEGYRFSEVIFGIVQSAPFRQNIVEAPATTVAER